MAMRRPLAPLGGKRLNTLNSSSQQLDLKNIKQSVVPAEKKSFSTNRFGGGSCLIPVDGAEDIDQYLRHIEIKYNVPKEFLRGHPGGVDGRMRQILVDWLFHVQKRFNFFTETLSLAVNVLDRALLVMPNINKDNLQLLGVTCLFCASKFEEILVPHIDDFVHVAADVFTKHDIFQMEQRVLSALNFDFGSTHSIHFLRRYRFYVSPSVEVYQLSKYICEVALISYQLAHYLPSTVAAVAIWLASYTHGRQLTSAQLFSNVFKMDQKELISIARIFVDYVLQYADSSERLYALRQKHHVSALELLTNAHVLRLHEFSDFGL